MDCGHVVAVQSATLPSQLLDEAVVLCRQVTSKECPLIHHSKVSEHLTSTTKPDLFILPYFNGPEYDLIKEAGLPIIGPAALLYLLKQEILLPRRLKTQPLYSLSLQGARICCSNIARDARDELYELVKSMGGTVSPALTNECTHLVVEEVGSKKYQFAMKFSIPIMSPEWITSLWAMCQKEVVKNDKSIVEQFKCPPFRGCTICVSGLDIARRTEVEHLATKYGGAYSGDLVMEKCTHLLIEAPEGNKFTFAQKWKIPCVRSKWFYDSIEKGLCMDIHEYEHEAINKENMTCEASYLVRPLLEETRDINVSNANNITVLDVTVNKDKGYLEGCKIYLAGFSVSEQDQLKKIINNGGGTRLDSLSNRVTHVVANTSTLKEIQVLSLKQPDAHIVSVQWLTDSMEQGVHQSETSYNLLPTTNVTTDNPLPNLGAAFKTIPKEYPKVDVDVISDDVLRQYSQNTPNPDTTITTYERPSRNTRKTTHNTTRSNVTTSAVDKTVNQTISLINKKSTLFSGLSFHVSTNIQHKVGKNVKHQVLQNDGQLRECAYVTDYCVVDAFTEVPNTCTSSDKIRTYMWLQRCIETGTLLSPDLCPLYKAKTIPHKCDVFKGKVISTTQFSGFELAHIEQCIKVLGGLMQGTFTYKVVANSKIRPDSLACTHLLHKDKIGTKHKAALKWKIPSVTVDWLYKCYTTLTLVDTAPYEDAETLGKLQTEHLTEAAKHLREAGITVTSSGTLLRNDKEGFVTPMKVTNKKLRGLKIDDVMDALASPACTGTDLSKRQSDNSLTSLYKQSITHAVKRTTPPAKLLSGVTITVKGTCRSFDAKISEIKLTARRLGAVLRTVLDNSCTHVICSAKDTKDSTLEQAVKRGVILVSYHWVLACEASDDRLPESEYPPGYDPKRSLNMSITEDTTIQSVDIDNTQKTANISNSDNCSLDPELKKQIEMLKQFESEERSESFVNPASTPRSRAIKRSCKITPITVPMEELLSQLPMSVTYEDGREAREALLARENSILAERRASVQRTDQSFSNVTMPHSNLPPNSSSTPCKDILPNAASTSCKDILPNPASTSCIDAAHEVLAGLNEEDFDGTGLTEPEVPPAPRTPPQFLLSGMTTLEKTQYLEIIVELGGKLLSSVGFDRNCTHLIVGKPSRNEKYLAALSAGIWLLHPSYIRDSEEKGEWLEERGYTWDNFTTGLNEMGQRLAKAGSHWKEKKAFLDWRVILCTDANKVSNFKSIIEAGGGTVLQTQPPYTVQSGITHAFCDFASSTMKLSVTRGDKNYVPILALYESGTLCVKPEYIAEILICTDKVPNTERFLVDHVRELMSKKRARETSFNEPNKRPRS